MRQDTSAEDQGLFLQLPADLGQDTLPLWASVSSFI